MQIVVARASAEFDLKMCYLFDRLEAARRATFEAGHSNSEI